MTLTRGRNTRNQSEISNVPRRHAGAVPRLELIASADIGAYQAVEAHGTRQGRPSVNQYAIGIAIKRAPSGSRVPLATATQTIQNEAWTWNPGIVYYDSSGDLTQTPGTRIGFALSPTEIYVLP